MSVRVSGGWQPLVVCLSPNTEFNIYVFLLVLILNLQYIYFSFVCWQNNSAPGGFLRHAE